MDGFLTTGPAEGATPAETDAAAVARAPRETAQGTAQGTAQRTAQGMAAGATGTARRGVPGLRAASLLGFVAVWWLVAWIEAKPRLLPDPYAVAVAAVQDALHGDLLYNFGVTLARVVAAFSLSMAAGTLIGVLAGRRASADALIDPVLTILLNLPLLVVIVLCYIWIGQTETGAIVAVALAKTPTIAVTVREGARALDPAYADVAAAFRIPRLRRIRHLLLPQLAPYVAAAARSGLSITWKIVLVVELLGRPSGVGYALNLAFQNFDVTAILAYGLLFAALMLAVEMAVLQPWERRTRAWRQA